MIKRVRGDAIYKPSKEMPGETFTKLYLSLRGNGQLAHAMATSNELAMLKRVGNATKGTTVAHLVAATDAGAQALVARTAWDPETMKGIFDLRNDNGVTVRDVVEARLYGAPIQTRSAVDQEMAESLRS